MSCSAVPSRVVQVRRLTGNGTRSIFLGLRGGWRVAVWIQRPLLGFPSAHQEQCRAQGSVADFCSLLQPEVMGRQEGNAICWKSELLLDE